jgi:hypothetical protein
VATAAEDCLNISAQLSRVVCGGPIAEQSQFGTTAVLGGGGGFKKLEAANLGPRRPDNSLKLARK